ncbi:hypothetical protein ACVND7_01440 [Avibacterium paragallinarum]|nr:hypothetical protein [Avibacterium paragallinarum]MEE3607874.1 hypothetical protein [Avibacterium paragallinarum]MEE3620301.1 hypothetical protein [Avibacterium paragallinarum]MEE3668209.1 hypothetical protein [Avibacterium paragallinarum]MEE3679718.1 hypothetical protein [Avibacterium paragallinarum]MEE4385132.1 hypothetical protein [Avibacterium paragallinarum]
MATTIFAVVGGIKAKNALKNHRTFVLENGFVGKVKRPYWEE